MRELLTERKEPVQLTGTLGDWQPVTIKFTGEVLPRDRTEAFKGAMFAAYPGDLVFSKIDARNGAVGLIPDSMSKVVLTPEYPVMVPNPAKLRPAYLHYLLRAEHFRHDLQRQASGTSGRKRVTPEAFLSLCVPVPQLHEQDALTVKYADALAEAAQKEHQAARAEAESRRTFEEALGVAPPPALPSRPAFITRFKDIERWSHEGVLRANAQPAHAKHKWPLMALGELIDDLENGWSPQCLDRPAQLGRWGVLKVGAVSFGYFNEAENKELPSTLEPRPYYEVKPGDVIISRANVTRYVGACAHVETTRPMLMLSDKLFRVRFRSDGNLDGRFLAAVMKLPTVREQVETRLTGTSPTMKNISKPALLSLKFPTPDLKTQRGLVGELDAAQRSARALSASAQALRTSAWKAFERALFDEK
ncbi:hypothetical protein BTK96_001046 [Burkholderia pyrrocinia]|nr:hypothetical protein [Burkholderia pyrrocinia]EKS9892797.1 hypothetical protein [Burkholderia pyrrocinia]EKS9907672.1 hypothetical protein [Burkholderia pyrrocinia]